MNDGLRIVNSGIGKAILAVLLLQGCQSYTIVQSNVFADDDARAVKVEYGRSGSDHVNTFVSPTTGKEMEFKSKLMVKVHLPDGDSFKAWQCMNFLTRGTMYASDNGKWKALADGFTFRIYLATDEEPPRYREVFRGVLCDSANAGVERDERWKEVLQHGKEYKRPKPITKTK